MIKRHLKWHWRALKFQQFANLVVYWHCNSSLIRSHRSFPELTISISGDTGGACSWTPVELSSDCRKLVTSDIVYHQAVFLQQTCNSGWWLHQPVEASCVLSACWSDEHCLPSASTCLGRLRIGIAITGSTLCWVLRLTGLPSGWWRPMFEAKCCKFRTHCHWGTCNKLQ